MCGVCVGWVGVGGRLPPLAPCGGGVEPSAPRTARDGRLREMPNASDWCGLFDSTQSNSSKEYGLRPVLRVAGWALRAHCGTVDSTYFNCV